MTLKLTKKRPAFRLGPDPHSKESVEFTVDRYGPIQPETMKGITDWLEKQGDMYKWEVGLETFPGGAVPHPILKTQRKGSFIFKITDNEYDARNTLENIRKNP